jgi:hypothetical protein
MHNRSLLDLIIEDIDTPLPEPALVAKRQTLDLSAPLHFFRSPAGEGGEHRRRVGRFGRFRHQHRCAQSTKLRTFVQALGTTPTLGFMLK